LAHYSYRDRSGNYFITIDTDERNCCGDCVSACPEEIFEVVEEDPNDPMNDEPLDIVRQQKKKRLECECGPCKLPNDRLALPCVLVCRAGAISYSWWGIAFQKTPQEINTVPQNGL